VPPAPLRRVEVCPSGVQPTLPPRTPRSRRFRVAISRTPSSPSSLASSLAMGDHLRARALRDLDGVADVLSVPDVSRKMFVGSARRPRPRLGVAVRNVIAQHARAALGQLEAFGPRSGCSIRYLPVSSCKSNARASLRQRRIIGPCRGSASGHSLSPGASLRLQALPAAALTRAALPSCRRRTPRTSWSAWTRETTPRSTGSRTTSQPSRGGTSSQSDLDDP